MLPVASSMPKYYQPSESIWQSLMQDLHGCGFSSQHSATPLDVGLAVSIDISSAPYSVQYSVQYSELFFYQFAGFQHRGSSIDAPAGFISLAVMTASLVAVMTASRHNVDTPSHRHNADTPRHKVRGVLTQCRHPLSTVQTRKPVLLAC